MAATVGSETWDSGDFGSVIQRFPPCGDVSKGERPMILPLNLGNAAVWDHSRGYYGKKIKLQAPFLNHLLTDLSHFSLRCSRRCPAWLEGLRGSSLTQIFKLMKADRRTFCALQRGWEWLKAPTGHLRKASFAAACRSCSSGSSSVWHRSGIKLEPVTRKPTPVRRGLGQRLQFVFLAELPRLSSCSGHKYFVSSDSITIFLQSLKIPYLTNQKSPGLNPACAILKNPQHWRSESTEYRSYYKNLTLTHFSPSSVELFPWLARKLLFSSFPRDARLLLTEFLFYMCSNTT